MPHIIEAIYQDVPFVLVNQTISTLVMDRPEKCNAMNEGLLFNLEAFFSAPYEGIRVPILTGIAGHCGSGLDLSEHLYRTLEENFSTRTTGILSQIKSNLADCPSFQCCVLR